MAETAQAHPMVLIHYDTLKNEDAKRSIAQLSVGYDDKIEYFVDRLAQALAHRSLAPSGSRDCADERL
jgi:pyruvate,water dikinase